MEIKKLFQKKTKVPPKIEIEFIGQEELEAEKKKQAEQASKKKKSKIRKVDFSKEKENSDEIEFTIQGLIPEEENTNKKPQKIIDFFKNKTNEEPSEEILQKRKQMKNILLIVLGILAILSIVLVLLYHYNNDFQANVDEYIFHKNKTSEDLVAIKLDASKDPKVLAYNGTLAVLAENNLSLYNLVGNKTGTLGVKVTDPISANDGRYMILGEKNKSNLYLIDGENIAWEHTIEGNIARVAVNKNGYSAIVITGTSYKSIIAVYDNKGNELFKIYLSTMSVADIDLSDDNRYLGLAEIDTTGTQIQSTIKIVDIDKAQNDPGSSIVYSYKAESGNLLIDLCYQSRARLVCLYDNSVHVTTLAGDEEIMKRQDENGKANFAGANLNGYAYRVMEQSSGLFKANTVLETVGISGKKRVTHTVSGTAKNVKASENTVVLDLGSEVEFLTSSGWLQKRYFTTRSIKDIVLSGNVVGIVYRDQIEIINL